MIWLSLGVVSIFWDKPMGGYIPLITTMLFGAFWSPVNPVLVLIVLYFHHLLGNGSGVFEILSITILATTKLVSDLFYNRTFLYILYASSIMILVFVNFGTIATVTSVIEFLIVMKFQK